MRMALIVGINEYQGMQKLWGCVNDALKVKEALENHYDGTRNFECKVLTDKKENDKEKNSVGKVVLRDGIKKLFSSDVEIAVFYFSGHGYVSDGGGYILASDSTRGDDGVSLAEVIGMANKSPARNKVIILDSCHSGAAGDFMFGENVAGIAEGVTILAAASKDQYATEDNGEGLFTGLLIDALNGGAANILGEITPGSVYAHIDQSLGHWKMQRPVFKTNVKQFVSLRRTPPQISIDDLRRITEFFQIQGGCYQLGPEYEPERHGCKKCNKTKVPPPDPEKNEIFAVLQRYNRLNLLVPVDATHMWHAAMQSKSCKLTPLGEHYRRLVIEERI